MSKAQAITFFRNGESIRLNDDSILEVVRQAGKGLSNEDIMDIVWGTEAVTPKEARRRYAPIYRATHNLVELGALLAHEDVNGETGGEESVYTFVPEGARVPVPSKWGYKAKFLEACERIRVLEASVVPLCPSCTCLLCNACVRARSKAVA